jgi:hypothetical protein
LGGNSGEIGPEIGPAVLLPNGTVFATGATGHNAIYTPPSNLTDPGTWVAAPDFPDITGQGQLDIADGPAALLPDGNVLVAASPGFFNIPTTFFEYDGTKLNQVPATSDAGTSGSSAYGFLLLPTGQVLAVTDIAEIYTPTGKANPAWAPTIASGPTTVGAGATYAISGTQFNGLSQAVSYGDDYQAATNYPLVRITNQATGHVFYARTHDHSTMAVATGSAIVSTNFDVPLNIETGASALVVVANGIPSASWPLTVITLKSSATALGSSPNPSLGGQSVLFTATVTGTGGTPTGKVTFFDGITSLGTGVLNASGVATLTTPSLTVGSHAITAQYGSDTNFSSSPSTAFAQVITGIPTTTSLLTFGPSQALGVTPFTAAVTGAGGTPTGTVALFEGSAWLGNSSLNSTGMAAFNIGPFGSLNVGSHSITAQYEGDTKFAASTSSVEPQVVTTIPTVVALTTSLNSSVIGQSVTITAKVTGSGSTPTGTVTFFDGTTSLGTGLLNASGVATLTTPSLTVGSHSITAKYGGDTNFSSSTSPAATETVKTAGFAPAPTGLTVKAGNSLPINLTLYAAAGSGLNFTLSCTNLPLKSSCSFGQNPVAPAAPPTGTTVQINFGTSSSELPAGPSDRGPWPWEILGISAALAALFLAGMNQLRQAPSRRLAFGICLAVFALASLLIGCGGSGSGSFSSTPAYTGTPKGPATFSVMGVSGTTTISVPVTVTVQ